MEKIHEIAITYYQCCVELKEVQEKIRIIYQEAETNSLGIEGETEYNNSVYEDIKKIFSKQSEAAIEDYSYKLEDPMNFYDGAGCKNSFDLLCEVFSLFEERKQIKKRKGAMTRLLYLQGKSIGTKFKNS